MADQHPFDRLARTLAQPQSRRTLLRQLGVGLAAAAAGSVVPRFGRTLADTAPCATGLSLCGSACVNLQGDPNNCGSCGNALPPGGTCINGQPAPSYTLPVPPQVLTFAPNGPAEPSTPPTPYHPAGLDGGSTATNVGSSGGSQPNATGSPAACMGPQEACNDAEAPCCAGLHCGANGHCCASDIGGPCGSSFDCCDGPCLNGICGSCLTPTMTCKTGVECCTSACVNGICCQVEGGSCHNDAECCGGRCDEGVCQKCRPTGSVCTKGGDCCGGACLNGVCGCGPGAPCASGLNCCNGACVDLTTDTNNCGTCGRECPLCVSANVTAPSICNGGVCQPAPPAFGARWLICNGVCTDVNSDPNNCGGCGRPCPVCTLPLNNVAPEICSGGACAAPSPGSFPNPAVNPAICSGICTDLNTDALNCGSCGHVCLSGRCVSGVCTCPEGQFSCGQGCCNNGVICCNHQCCAPGVSSCRADGTCGCPAGQTVCGASCCTGEQNCATSGQFAGQCVCSATGQLPVNGVCACPPGQTLVNGQCVCPQGYTKCGARCCPPSFDLCKPDGTCSCGSGNNVGICLSSFSEAELCCPDNGECCNFGQLCCVAPLHCLNFTTCG